MSDPAGPGVPPMVHGVLSRTDDREVAGESAASDRVGSLALRLVARPCSEPASAEVGGADCAGAMDEDDRAVDPARSVSLL
jgi:hypothetical protein